MSTDPDPGSIMTILPLEVSSSGSSWGITILQIIILFVLILINAFFAMSEIAVISLNDTKIDKLAQEGSKKAKQILKLTADSSGFLSTIQIGVTLAGFLTSAFAASTFAERLTAWVLSVWQNAPETVIDVVATILITIIMSYFSLVLGELVPKKIAMQDPEKVSFKVVGILLGFSKITKPFVKLLSASTNLVVRLLGFDPNADEEEVTEENILLMVDAGEEKGVIENTQAEMINNIFEMDDIDAGDLMTHRVDMTAVEADEPISTVVELATAEGYSRIPVYDDDPDNIVGVVYVKDLLRYVGAPVPQDDTIRSVMREAYFVPESKHIHELFREMGEKRTQLAIVIDEYGGTAGLITLEDILESIVGSINDEYDEIEDDVNKLSENIFTVDGSTHIDEIEELVGVEFPEDDYDTIAGFVIDKLGYLPVDGNLDTVEYENLKLTVLSVEDRRILDVQIEILPKPEEPDTEEE